MTRARLGLVTAALATLASAVVVGVPVWLIQPFAPQTPAAVEWSWRLRQAAPSFTLAAAAVTLLAVAAAWRRAPAPRGTIAIRTAMTLLVGLAIGAAWFARQNHFEWRFRPLPDPQFVAVADAAGLDADEPVIGVAQGGAALAFPITRIGYHHLVNTTLGDVPIVATY